MKTIHPHPYAARWRAASRLLMLVVLATIGAAAPIAAPALAQRGPVVRSPSPAPPATGEMVRFTVRDEEIDGYLVRPGASEARIPPGIVLIHEWWGLNEQIRGVAERAAESGYVVLVPDLYRGKLPTDLGYAQTFARDLDQDWALAAVGAAAGYLRTLDGAARRPVAVVGFDLGGVLSLRAALKGMGLRAAVAVYGTASFDEQALKKMRVPYLGIYGAFDRATPEADINALKAALEKYGKQAEIFVFPEAGRFFFNEERPGYDDEAAFGAWEQIKMFLEKHINEDPMRLGKEVVEDDFEQRRRKHRRPPQ